MKKNNLITPGSILLGFMILGSSIFLAQLSRQKSIERQEKTTLSQQQEERCQKLAIQEKNDILKENQNPHLSSFEYHYNLNTKMCILAYVKNYFLDLTYSQINYVVVDLFTNEEIYNKGGIFNRKDEAKEQYNEWKHIANLYFTQQERRII